MTHRCLNFFKKMYKFQRIKKKKKEFRFGNTNLEYELRRTQTKKKKMDENTILFLTFWGYSQFRS